MADLLEGGGLVVSGAVAVKGLELLIARFVRRSDEASERAAVAQAEREHAMDAKLDQLLREVAELKVETRNDRESAKTMSAAIQAAVGEVKSRIDGVSANHGPRLNSLEQEIAALRTRFEVLTSRGRK